MTPFRRGRGITNGEAMRRLPFSGWKQETAAIRGRMPLCGILYSFWMRHLKVRHGN